MDDQTVKSDGLTPSENRAGSCQSPRLLDRVRNVIRCKHYSIRTEHSYIEWIKRYIYCNYSAKYLIEVKKDLTRFSGKKVKVARY